MMLTRKMAAAKAERRATFTIKLDAKSTGAICTKGTAALACTYGIGASVGIQHALTIDSWG
jgi:hypothetical protein